MQALNLPTYLFNTKSENGNTYIFDPVRRKFVNLSPEEWVRQNFIKYLTDEKKVPITLISVEKELRLNKLKKRTDILIHSKNGDVVAIVECKAPEIKITTGVFDQILRYNLVYSVPIIIVTNGMTHYCCELNHETGKYQFLNEIPGYEKMI
jgi:type I site-specific restriction endonuclease